MSTLEVLRVRVTDGSRQSILDKLHADRETMKIRHGVERVELLLNESLESDLAVHLYWKTGALQSEKSELAEEIMGGLRDRGVLHHTIWIEGENYGN